MTERKTTNTSEDYSFGQRVYTVIPWPGAKMVSTEDIVDECIKNPPCITQAIIVKSSSHTCGDMIVCDPGGCVYAQSIDQIAPTPELAIEAALREIDNIELRVKKMRGIYQDKLSTGKAETPE